MTTEQTLTPVSDQTPVTVEIQDELSGPQWVPLFPGSNSIDDLAEPFKSNAERFIAALKNAGAIVSISSTYRPPERAYLMHYSAKIANNSINPSSVPKMDGVNIEWDHGNPEDSKNAARQMRDGYQIVYPPALSSRHTQRSAIDMTISDIIGKYMVNSNGNNVFIENASTLYSVGATYGCIKLLSDPPHWSDNGH